MFRAMLGFLAMAVATSSVASARVAYHWAYNPYYTIPLAPPSGEIVYHNHFYDRGCMPGRYNVHRYHYYSELILQTAP